MGGFLLVCAGGLFVVGGQEAYTGFRYAKPASTTVGEFVHHKSDAKFLEFRDAIAFLPGAVQLYHKGIGDKPSAAKIYIPLYAELPTRGGVASSVMVLTSDPESVALFNKAVIATAGPARDTVKSRIAAWSARPRTFRGTVVYGVHADGDDRKLLQKAANATDFIVLEEGLAPSWIVGAVMLALGAIAGFYGLRGVIEEVFGRRTIFPGNR